MKYMKILDNYSIIISNLLINVPFILIFYTVNDNILLFDKIELGDLLFQIIVLGVLFTIIQAKRLWNVSFWHRFMLFYSIAMILFWVFAFYAYWTAPE